MKAFFTTLLVAGAIGAMPAIAAAQDQPQARVPVKDLDLTKAKDRMQATDRLGKSASAACPNQGAGLQGQQEAADCREDLMQKGSAQLAQRADEAQAAKDAEMRRWAAMHRTPVKHRHYAKHKRHVVHHVTKKAPAKATTAKK